MFSERRVGVQLLITFYLRVESVFIISLCPEPSMGFAKAVLMSAVFLFRDSLRATESCISSEQRNPAGQSWLWVGISTGTWNSELCIRKQGY